MFISYHIFRCLFLKNFVPLINKCGLTFYVRNDVGRNGHHTVVHMTDWQAPSSFFFNGEQVIDYTTRRDLNSLSYNMLRGVKVQTKTKLRLLEILIQRNHFEKMPSWIARVVTIATVKQLYRCWYSNSIKFTAKISDGKFVTKNLIGWIWLVRQYCHCWIRCGTFVLSFVPYLYFFTIGACQTVSMSFNTLLVTSLFTIINLQDINLKKKLVTLVKEQVRALSLGSLNVLFLLFS